MSKKQDDKLAALRAALIDGEQSGPAEPFDFEAFLLKKRKERKASIRAKNHNKNIEP
jgi:antitoxin ParD1/3/4